MLQNQWQRTSSMPDMNVRVETVKQIMEEKPKERRLFKKCASRETVGLLHIYEQHLHI